MEVCEIRDLKSTGRFFTWTNKQENTARVLSKFDRVMGNDSWESIFPMAEDVFFLEGTLIILRCQSSSSSSTEGPNHSSFLTIRGNEWIFQGVIQDIWNTPIQGLKSHQTIQKLKLIQATYKQKFKKDEQTTVILVANNLLKDQEEVHAYPTNVHLIKLECKMADLL